MMLDKSIMVECDCKGEIVGGGGLTFPVAAWSRPRRNAQSLSYII